MIQIFRDLLVLPQTTTFFSSGINFCFKFEFCELNLFSFKKARFSFLCMSLMIYLFSFHLNRMCWFSFQILHVFSLTYCFHDKGFLSRTNNDKWQRCYVDASKLNGLNVCWFAVTFKKYVLCVFASAYYL